MMIVEEGEVEALMARIKFVGYKDLYFPVVVTNKNFRVGVVASYFIHKRRKLTLDELHALVAHEMFGGATSSNLKRFLYDYVRLLAANGIVSVEEKDGEKVICAQAVPFPIKFTLLGVMHADEKKYLNKRTIRAWLRGESIPSVKKLLEVLL